MAGRRGEAGPDRIDGDVHASAKARELLQRGSWQLGIEPAPGGGRHGLHRAGSVSPCPSPRPRPKYEHRSGYRSRDVAASWPPT